jgi:hypothetical protein
MDGVAEIDDPMRLIGGSGLDRPGPLVLLLDDLKVGEFDGSDHREAEVGHEEAADLVLALLAGGEVETEALGREAASVREGHPGIEYCAEVRHPLSPFRRVRPAAS